ncbi:MAG: metal ABC transporter substrate-binding protein [Xanthobacteraceae bacterium]
MRSAFGFVRAAALILLLATNGHAGATAKLKAVASFSILGDMVRAVGGDRVEVVSLVGANGDVHAYEPSPRDAKALTEAKLLVVNGLGFEGWMPRLVDPAHFKGTLVVASNGIKTLQIPRKSGNDTRVITDPHAWQSLVNGRTYVENIRDGLSAADPDGRPLYETNANRYLAAIDQLNAEIKATIGTLPPERRRIITSHDAFGYFGAEYGLQFMAPEGVSTDSQASAQDVARIIRQIKAGKIPAVFIENVTDHRLLDQIARETGAKIGGELYSDALSGPDGPAATYLDLVRHNVATLTAALARANASINP